VNISIDTDISVVEDARSYSALPISHSPPLSPFTSISHCDKFNPRWSITGNCSQLVVSTFAFSPHHCQYSFSPIWLAPTILTLAASHLTTFSALLSLFYWLWVTVSLPTHIWHSVWFSLTILSFVEIDLPSHLCEPLNSRSKGNVLILLLH